MQCDPILNHFMFCSIFENAPLELNSIIVFYRIEGRSCFYDYFEYFLKEGCAVDSCKKQHRSAYLLMKIGEGDRLKRRPFYD